MGTYEKKIEIPFGAFDSDLFYQEIYIPNGFEATIKGNKIFLKKTESENENIRKALISFVNHDGWKFTRLTKEEKESWIAWLEKQGKQSNSSPIWKYKKDNKPLLHDSLILNKYGGVAKSPSGAIVSDVWVLDYDELAKLPKEKLEEQAQSTFDQCKQGGDRIVTNSDGTHFNLSQLERVAKAETPEESLGVSSEKYNEIVDECIFGAETEENEEKVDNANKVESNFNVGDWVVYCGGHYQITSLNNNIFTLTSCNGSYFFNNVKSTKEPIFHPWTIQDANDGDVLVNGSNIFIFHFLNDTRLMGYCHVNTDDGRFYDDIGKNECFCLIDAVVNPTTKEQRDLLFKKMYEAGYMWDVEKKELRKIEQQSSQWNISEYRTWQYIVDDVLTKYNGIGQYLDDGFCKKIAKYMQENWSKKLSLGQISAWTGEDEKNFNSLDIVLFEDKNMPKEKYWEIINWLNSLKQRMI